MNIQSLLRTVSINGLAITIALISVTPFFMLSYSTQEAVTSILALVPAILFAFSLIVLVRMKRQSQ